jgi:hypothetical protein
VCTASMKAAELTADRNQQRDPTTDYYISYRWQYKKS